MSVDLRRTVPARLQPPEERTGAFEPGDVMTMTDEVDGPVTALGFGCPGCGGASILHLGSGPDRHTWQVTGGDPSKPESLSVRPSIHHSGGCGWHGYLTDGVFAPC